MKKIVSAMLLLVLGGCNQQYLGDPPHTPLRYEVQSKLLNKTNEYSVVYFNEQYFATGPNPSVNFETVVRVGKTRLQNFRYMSAGMIENQKNAFDKKIYMRWGNVFYGYSSSSQQDAINKSIEACELFFSKKCGVIVNYDFAKIIDEQKSTLQTASANQATITKKQEDPYERYLKQCEQIGFKRNTEKIGECALKIKDIEAKIQISNSQISNSQTAASQSSQQQNTQTTQSQNNSADTLANLVILNEAIKLMNPPKRNFNCQARPFGTYTNVYCN
jgi:hypothetical protein